MSQEFTSKLNSVNKQLDSVTKEIQSKIINLDNEGLQGSGDELEDLLQPNKLEFTPEVKNEDYTQSLINKVEIEQPLSTFEQSNSCEDCTIRSKKTFMDFGVQCSVGTKD